MESVQRTNETKQDRETEEVSHSRGGMWLFLGRTILFQLTEKGDGVQEEVCKRGNGAWGIGNGVGARFLSLNQHHPPLPIPHSLLQKHRRPAISAGPRVLTQMKKYRSLEAQLQREDVV